MTDCKQCGAPDAKYDLTVLKYAKSFLKKTDAPQQRTPPPTSEETFSFCSKDCRNAFWEAQRPAIASPS